MNISSAIRRWEAQQHAERERADDAYDAAIAAEQELLQDGEELKRIATGWAKCGLALEELLIEFATTEPGRYDAQAMEIIEQFHREWLTTFQIEAASRAS